MHLINEEIKAKQIKIVEIEKDKVEIKDTDGKPLLLTLSQALQMAEERNLDLVEMSKVNEVSICKLINYSKYLYEKKKSVKKVKKSVVKDIKFGCNIADHDLKIFANKALKILEEGNKVRVCVVFKGRQKALVSSMGKNLLDKFILYFNDNITIVREPKLEGDVYTMVIQQKVIKK